MKKKYYFLSIWEKLFNILVAVILVTLITVRFFSDVLHVGIICTIVLFSIGLIMLLFWIVFSFSMRIEFDYDKKELCIRHPYFLKRLKFEDILSIQILRKKRNI